MTLYNMYFDDTKLNAGKPLTKEKAIEYQNECIRNYGYSPEMWPVEAIHYRPYPSATHNVRCLNGNYHARVSFGDMDSVTCPLCLNEKTNEDFWLKYKQKYLEGK